METNIHNPKVKVERFDNFDIIKLFDGNGMVNVYVDRKQGKPQTKFALDILEADVEGHS